jgi:hypothetical protein
MPTLKDTSTANQFASHTYKVLYKNWEDLDSQERAESIEKSLLAALKPCGVPPPGFELKSGMSDLGVFHSKPWKIQINSKHFGKKKIKKDEFIEIASTFYHETRHCEQAWHIARFDAMVQNSFVNMSANLSIPVTVAQKAVSKKMKHNDAMLKLATLWHESIYGSGKAKRELTLQRSNLRQNGSDRMMHGFRLGAWNQYSGSLPEEKDAWTVEKLVVNQLKTLIK